MADRNQPHFRVGIGFDAHRFGQGRPLILGGINVPHSQGLEGHSDADVLSHAICDALLGAMAEGDIGQHFPDSDPRYRGIQSLQLLRQVRKMAATRQFCVANVDATIVAQVPPLSPHLSEMRAKLAESLGTDVTTVSVKATTTEGMGFPGRSEGIAAFAVALLEKL
jgi:2-C-methyl-D-erythritol 2,4-cyclodiphosphate synthase